MRPSLPRPKSLLVTVALLSTMSLPSYAQQAQPLGGAPRTFASELDVLNAIYSEIKGFLDKNLESEHPFFDKINMRNNGLAQSVTKQQENTEKSVNSLLPFMLGPQLKDPALGGQTNGQFMSRIVTGITAGDSFTATGVPGIFSSGGANDQIRMCGNLNYSFQSLVGPNEYTNRKFPECGDAEKAESTFANNFILTLGDFGTPINDFSPAKALKEQMVDNDAQALELAKSQAYTQFKLARRYIVATRSIGLSNLFYLYNQRLPSIEIDGKQKSQMGLNNENATSRIGNPNWYAEMVKAYPAQLARETVFILAEMQQELHQMNVTMQRSLATQSTVLLQTAAAGNQMLQLYMGNIDAEIQKIKDKAAGKEASSSNSPGQLPSLQDLKDLSKQTEEEARQGTQ